MLDGTRVPELVAQAEKSMSELSITGLAYLALAMKASGDGDANVIVQRILAEAKQEPRATSWPASNFFWSSAVKNTAMAAWALMSVHPEDPQIPRAIEFLVNRKKARPTASTQDALATSLFIDAYAKAAREEDTDFTARATIGGKELFSAGFDRAKLMDVAQASMPMEQLTKQRMPADVNMEKRGDGTLFYGLLLKYYLPPDLTPTREEGLIISRQYYALDDVKEEKPLTTFKVGENYKGHITIVAPQEMNYVVVEDLLPAGFEPIDLTLSTSSRAAQLAARPDDEIFRHQWEEMPYDDVVPETDYGMSFAFRHQEVHDDKIVWSDEAVPAGTYDIRYPVRATTSGTFLLPGAQAFEFYQPEIFGRSVTRMIEVKRE
jgi:uncharacterized protein YfaS (alpha-2-macroglobulin family)